MALEIEINKEVTDYKPKVLLGLDGRKLIASILILSYGVPLCATQWDKMSQNELILLMLAGTVVPGFIGFCPNWNGVTPEKMFGKLWHNYIDPQKRKYQELPVFWHVREELVAGRLAEQRAERRQALKGGKKRKKKLSEWNTDGEFAVSIFL